MYADASEHLLVDDVIINRRTSSNPIGIRRFEIFGGGGGQYFCLYIFTNLLVY